MEGMDEEAKHLMPKLAKILDDSKASNATHIRKLKELSAIRSKFPQFAPAFFKTLTPLFHIHRRIASAERVIRFVSLFATTRDPDNVSVCDEFLEDFLKFLLVATKAANKTARFRACQIISEIIMRLPDDAEVSNDLWDEVIECMKLRVRDKVSNVRTFAVRALSRFGNDAENSDVLDLFLEVLPLEQNAEVRKAIVLSLPPSNATSLSIINHTMDVSESVRKAAYCVLAEKFPLQSLSIKLRTEILQRGLTDRSAAVSRECLKLMKNEWLSKSCNDDPIKLLKYLDVETYESVGASVLDSLLKDGFLRLHDGQTIRQYLSMAPATNEGVSGNYDGSIQLMDPEFALYWKIVCRHLQTKAQEKGSDAAGTMGTEAAVYAAEASDNNDLLERILPETVSDYVVLVKAHINAGTNYRFATRQLLLLGAMLDFSDSSSRKVAGSFVQELLHKPLDHEIDDEGNHVVIGDGINLGGDKAWADAVSSLAGKVHAAAGEFEEVILGVIGELARPCRERTADFLQWMHCLAVTSLLLENAKSMHWLQGKAIEPAELLHSLLIPGAKHVHLDVQRAAIRCLGLFGLIEKKPSEELVKQLRISFVKGTASVSKMACKGLIDLVMWHGPQEVDKALGQGLVSHFNNGKMEFDHVNFCDDDDNLNSELLDLLYVGLDRNDWTKPEEYDEYESVHSVLAEGFAKILLLSEKYPSIPTSLHPLLLAKLIVLYFSNETRDMQRLKQCLSVFFEHYPALSVNHKKCLSKAFIPVMRSMWPGIFDNCGGASSVVSNMRKRAVQASRFMLQMMQAPLFAKEIENKDESAELPETINSSLESSFECGEEGLAIRIAAEVASFPSKKTAAEKSYISALSRILALLQFRSSEQAAVKLIRQLLNNVADSVSADKDLIKELKQVADRLKLLDSQPDEKLSQDQINLIMGRLEVELKSNIGGSYQIPQTPAAPRSTKPSRTRRRARKDDVCEDSDEETPPTTVGDTISVSATIGPRSQRASKTAALNKMTASKVVRIVECDDEESEEERSEVSSEDNSDDSDVE
ncbi:ARM repeat superfamily protein [Euphorbia peplus]|nr:ARM repeat superfamily protein [Euphorbia peplus]